MIIVRENKAEEDALPIHRAMDGKPWHFVVDHTIMML